ncbi:MAG: hypothetical protein Q4F79_09175 [Eubacteriales bacterium]|nr:hypothetical protein [Eubacteriales bacterium]
MKILMIVFLIGFLVFGAIGLVIRLSHDWNKLEVETDKLSEYSTAKRDGRAMQIVKHEHAIDAEQVQKKVDHKFRRQLLFSVLSGLCLVAAIVCGAIMQA